MSDEMNEVFALAVLNALESKQSHGVVGRSTADGNTDVDVPGRPGYVYVELGAGEEVAGVIEAMNLHVPRLAGTPVRLMKLSAMWLITGLDYASERLGSEHSNVPPHVHTRDNGLPQRALDLVEMPSSLVGAAGQYLRVRNDEAGFFLADAPGGGGGAEEFTDLDDTPNGYGGEGGKFVAVRGDESGLEFVTSTPGSGAESFTDLDDVPGSYSGLGGRLLRVKADESGVEAVVERPWVTDWSYRSNNRSSSSFAWKGNEFTPYLDAEVLALAYYGTLVAGATYQAAIVTGDASPGNIATIVKSAAVTLPGTLASTEGGWIWLYFGAAQLLTAGTVYGLMLGRTDNIDTYALPVPFTGSATAENSVPMAGRSHGRAWRIAKANPTVGDAIDLATGNTLGCGFMFRYS